MPVNLELKVKVNSHKPIEKLLKNIDAQYIDILKQKDVYFKTKKNILKLRIEGKNNTLIKYTRNEKGKRFSNYELLKLEGKNPLKYLTELFTIDTIVDKKRKLYIFNNTRIHIDEVKSLGKFIELETLVIKDKPDAIARFNYIKKALELDGLEEIKTSYKNLLKKK